MTTTAESATMAPARIRRSATAAVEIFILAQLSADSLRVAVQTAFIAIKRRISAFPG